MIHHCPNCHRMLYNRRLAKCGFCGAAIPEAMRFTPDECAVIDKKLADLEAERLRRERAAAEEEEQMRSEGDVGGIVGSAL